MGGIVGGISEEIDRRAEAVLLENARCQGVLESLIRANERARLRLVALRDDVNRHTKIRICQHCDWFWPTGYEPNADGPECELKFYYNEAPAVSGDMVACGDYINSRS